jgi:hypothetical protein
LHDIRSVAFRFHIISLSLYVSFFLCSVYAFRSAQSANAVAAIVAHSRCGVGAIDIDDNEIDDDDIDNDDGDDNNVNDNGHINDRSASVDDDVINDNDDVAIVWLAYVILNVRPTPTQVEITVDYTRNVSHHMHADTNGGGGDDATSHMNDSGGGVDDGAKKPKLLGTRLEYWLTSSSLHSRHVQLNGHRLASTPAGDVPDVVTMGCCVQMER